MTKEEVEKKCREIIKTQLDVQGFNNSAELITDLGADTLDVIEICMECENEFMITIPEEDWEKVLTFQEMVDICYQHVSKNNEI